MKYIPTIFTVLLLSSCGRTMSTKVEHKKKNSPVVQVSLPQQKQVEGKVTESCDSSVLGTFACDLIGAIISFEGNDSVFIPAETDEISESAREKIYPRAQENGDVSFFAGFSYCESMVSANGYYCEKFYFSRKIVLVRAKENTTRIDTIWNENDDYDGYHLRKNTIKKGDYYLLFGGKCLLVSKDADVGKFKSILIDNIIDEANGSSLTGLHQSFRGFFVNRPYKKNGRSAKVSDYNNLI